MQQRRVHEEGATGPPRVGLEELTVMRWRGRMRVRVCSSVWGTVWDTKAVMPTKRRSFAVTVFQGPHAVLIPGHSLACFRGGQPTNTHTHTHHNTHRDHPHTHSTNTHTHTHTHKHKHSHIHTTHTRTHTHTTHTHTHHHARVCSVHASVAVLPHTVHSLCTAQLCGLGGYGELTTLECFDGYGPCA